MAPWLCSSHRCMSACGGWEAVNKRAPTSILLVLWDGAPDHPSPWPQRPAPSIPIFPPTDPPPHQSGLSVNTWLPCFGAFALAVPSAQHTFPSGPCAAASSFLTTQVTTNAHPAALFFQVCPPKAPTCLSDPLPPCRCPSLYSTPNSPCSTEQVSAHDMRTLREDRDRSNRGSPCAGQARAESGAHAPAAGIGPRTARWPGHRRSQ